MSRPRILVSNDDGWQSPGIHALADALATFADVWVVAPERERSAVSHALSLHKPLRLRETAHQRFWCSGSPADSVYIAMHHVLPGPPDLVVSGINRGANLGDDVFYSGTVAAAREAALMGIPAIAVSQVTASGVTVDYAVAAQAAVTVARRALAVAGTADAIPTRTLLNINAPAGARPDAPLVLTIPGRRNYGREVQKSLDPRGQAYYWIGGPELGFDPLEGSDCDAVAAGQIAITPVSLDPRAPSAEPIIARWGL